MTLKAKKMALCALAARYATADPDQRSYKYCVIKVISQIRKRNYGKVHKA
jgi:hypothetical protein